MHDSGNTGVVLREVSGLLAKVQVRYTGNQSAKANKSKNGKAK